MYRAIIVDDEESIRCGLVNHFDWKKHDIDVAGVFEDGIPALDFALQNQVDLIITDVRMRHMDGISLAKKVLERFPDVKIVFISGYADVDYLKDALKMEAVDYILKSIDLDELDAVISKVTGMLNRHRSEKKLTEDMARKLKQSMPLLHERKLCALLKDDGESEEAVLESMEALDIPLNSTTLYAVLVLELQSESKWAAMGGMTEKERILFDMSIEELFGRELARYEDSVVFKDHSFEYIAILNVECDEYEEKLLNVAKHLQTCMKQEMEQEVFIGISEPFSGLCNVRGAYASACEAISRRYLIGKNIPTSIKKYEDDGNSRALREQADKKICSSILSGDVSAVHTALEKAAAGTSTLLTEDEQQNFMIFLLMVPAKLLTNMKAENMGPYTSWWKLAERFLQCKGFREQLSMLSSVYEEINLPAANLLFPTTAAQNREACFRPFMRPRGLAKRISDTSAR